MADKESETRVDPELERQLDEAGLDDRPGPGRRVRARQAADGPHIRDRGRRAGHRGRQDEGRDRPRPRQRHALHRDGRGRGTRVIRPRADRRDRCDRGTRQRASDDDPGLGKVSAGRDPTTHAGATGDDPTKAARAAGRRSDDESGGWRRSRDKADKRRRRSTAELTVASVEGGHRVADRLRDVLLGRESRPVARLVGDRQRVELHLLEQLRQRDRDASPSDISTVPVGWPSGPGRCGRIAVPAGSS